MGSEFDLSVEMENLPPDHKAMVLASCEAWTVAEIEAHFKESLDKEYEEVLLPDSDGDGHDAAISYSKVLRLCSPWDYNERFSCYLHDEDNFVKIDGVFYSYDDVMAGHGVLIDWLADRVRATKKHISEGGSKWAEECAQDEVQSEERKTRKSRGKGVKK